MCAWRWRVKLAQWPDAPRKKRPEGRFFEVNHQGETYAAFNHMAVSNALLIKGMFMPKLEFAADLEALAGFSVTLGAISVARSHDPIS